MVINAPNVDLKLKPGLTANISIYTMERNGVTSVPSKALRFTPEPAIIGKKYIIKDVQGSGKLWTIEGNVLVAHKVTTGISDGVHTEIVEGIDEGTAIVTDIVAGDDATAMEKSGEGGNSPFMPGPRNRNKSQQKK